MKACPFCLGRATKLLSLTTGLITCQQCDRSYSVEGVKEAVASAVARTNAEFEHRFIHGGGTGTPAGLLGQPETSATYGSISNRCLFAGCFYPLGDMCVFCFRLRPAPALGVPPVCPSYCAAATPEECDHPHGCSSCKSVDFCRSLMPIQAWQERLLRAIFRRKRPSFDAVARPVSSKAGPSMRAEKKSGRPARSTPATPSRTRAAGDGQGHHPHHGARKR